MKRTIRPLPAVLTDALTPPMCKCCNRAPACTADDLCAGCAGRMVETWRRLAALMSPNVPPSIRWH
jgi:hypothetical protein